MIEQFGNQILQFPAFCGGTDFHSPHQRIGQIQCGFHKNRMPALWFFVKIRKVPVKSISVFSYPCWSWSKSSKTQSVHVRRALLVGKFLQEFLTTDHMDHADKTDPLKQKTPVFSYPCWSCHLTKVGRGGPPGRLSYRLAVWLEGRRIAE